MTRKKFVFTLLNALLTDGMSIQAKPIRKCKEYLIEQEEIEEYIIDRDVWKYTSLPSKEEFIQLIPLSIIQGILTSESLFLDEYFVTLAKEAYNRRFSK